MIRKVELRALVLLQFFSVTIDQSSNGQYQFSKIKCAVTVQYHTVLYDLANTTWPRHQKASFGPGK
jgi:hypothetical protein